MLTIIYTHNTSIFMKYYILNVKIIIFKYIEDYPSEIHEKENQYCHYYANCIEDARKSIYPDLVCNGFVTRLWYRRYLNNQMRCQYEKNNSNFYLVNRYSHHASLG